MSTSNHLPIFNQNRIENQGEEAYNSNHEEPKADIVDIHHEFSPNQLINELLFKDQSRSVDAINKRSNFALDNRNPSLDPLSLPPLDNRSNSAFNCRNPPPS
ncbi:hypothetical protein Droror1_Dr00012461 [Drosera rotundifolia]